MYEESWGLKRICPMCSKQYYDLGRTELECPECGKEIEVTTMSRPRRGRKPGSTNAAPLVNPIPPKPKEKEDELDIENLDLDNNEDQVEDDTVLLEDETDIYECVLFPKIFADFGDIINWETLFIIYGTVEQSFGVCSINIKKIASLKEWVGRSNARGFS